MRIPKLYVYIFREHQGPFFAAILVLAFLFISNLLMTSLDKLLGKNLGFVAIEYILLNLAWILAMAVPMAVLISTLMAYGRLGEDNEITAMRASGISFASIIRPSLLFAFVVMLGLLYFNNYILPDANHRARLLKRAIYQKHPDLNINAGYFLYDIPDYTLFIRKKEGNTLQDLLIYHTSPEGQHITVWAHTGNLSTQGTRVILDLQEGEIHEYPAEKDKEYRILRFEKHRITIPVDEMSLQRNESDHRGDREMDIAEMMTMVRDYRERQEDIRNRIKSEMARWDADTTVFDIKSFELHLKNRITAIEKDSIASNPQKARTYQQQIRTLKARLKRLDTDMRILQAYKMQENKYLVEVHKKVSMPVACIIFVLVGAPLGIIARRGSMGVAVGVSVVFFLVYWASLMGGERLADRAIISPWVAMWSSNIVFGLLGIFLVWYAIREQVTLKIFRKSIENESSES
ncbi:MAG: lipopolysaccharide export system permease protein [Candidatus Marinimicrobia bacterium]|jgi:lipopolysaccharide export system permease protein|nr:lipopolysaccharide export system permease protein [Candidatus Neomarinimicrobiota bacterium]